ncbi:MAG: sugar phosphate isomerase/epimerase family protein [bacterium]|nr:sugar phosphate isomerase/epimerase family protein [bacterium]
MSEPRRRDFLKGSLLAGAGLGLLPLVTRQSAMAYPRPTENKISLATWSINRTFFMGGWKMDDLPRIVREDFGIDGIEHVNQFFDVPTETNLNRWNQRAKDYGVQNVLIMVDHEGAMVAKEEAVRKQAVINHRKWVDIAAYMGCHAIRCNAYGGGSTPEEDPDALDRAAESFHALVDYAAEQQINVIIENHGGLSSYPGWLPALCKKVDSPHFGLLPDYGNYPDGVDKYEEIEKAMPDAKGVSVKTAWNPDGESSIDLPRMLNISLAANYSGFWGIESGYQFKSGDLPIEEVRKGEWQAVLWTKKVIEEIVLKQG